MCGFGVLVVMGSRNSKKKSQMPFYSNNKFLQHNKFNPVNNINNKIKHKLKDQSLQRKWNIQDKCISAKARQYPRYHGPRGVYGLFSGTSCDMIDIPSQGPHFTSTNGRKGRHRIDMKMDRELGELVEKSSHSFRFLAMWCQREDCKQIVKEVWSTQTKCCLYAHSAYEIEAL
ncbi:hypothetical protein VNO80_22337 [Phaseolus coccineus]|uniref:Uncharacterized protein n=1 Tax=Phaseolus coccineus TaxID=3886 RepID=A0AAN9MAA4_PHACN